MKSVIDAIFTADGFHQTVSLPTITLTVSRSLPMSHKVSDAVAQSLEQLKCDEVLKLASEARKNRYGARQHSEYCRVYDDDRPTVREADLLTPPPKTRNHGFQA